MILFLVLFALSANYNEQSDDVITKQLDMVWAEMSKTVAAGDYEGYAAIYHPDAILVSGYSKNSYRIKQALLEWKQGFDDTKAGKMTASASFRFSQRLHNDDTAHETGMFHYYTINSKGKRTDQYVHMNALLIKKAEKWLVMMEYQKHSGTKDEWEALK